MQYELDRIKLPVYQYAQVPVYAVNGLSKENERMGRCLICDADAGVAYFIDQNEDEE